MSGAVTSGPDTMRLARDERADLADFLATLTPEQWDAPTLCPLWRVRDVVAHIFSYEDLGLLAREVALDRVQAALRFAPGARPIGAPDASAGYDSPRPTWTGSPVTAPPSKGRARRC